MSASTPEPVVAAFDFDGTLTSGDNVVPFLRRVAGVRRIAVGAVRRAPRLLPALARFDRDRVKAIMTEIVFTDRRVADVARRAQEFGAEIVAADLRPDTFERVHWHVAHGHRVVIVSASYEVYLHVVAEKLGLHGVIATRLEATADGRYTGRLLGRNCRGTEKLRRLDDWLADEGLDRRSITLWAYGDSKGDQQLLEAADHPIWAKDPIASVAASA